MLTWTGIKVLTTVVIEMTIYHSCFTDRMYGKLIVVVYFTLKYFWHVMDLFNRAKGSESILFDQCVFSCIT